MKLKTKAKAKHTPVPLEGGNGFATPEFVKSQPDIKITSSKLKETYFLNKLVRGTAVTLNTAADCMWFLASAGDQVVGACCAKGGGGVWRFKSDIVSVMYRGEGIYRRLWDARMSYVKEQTWKRITAFSSADSRPMYIKEGFRAMNAEGTKNMYMVLEKEDDTAKSPKSWGFKGA